MGTTLVLLILYVAINLIGYYAMGSAVCRGAGVAVSTLDTARLLAIIGGVLALYALFAMIRRRITLQKTPFELQAAVLATIVSAGWVAYYFLDCKRYL